MLLGELPDAKAQPNLEDLVRPSRFIFQGTIKTLNATTVANFPATDSTSIVKVDKVLYTPGTLGDFTNKDITIQSSRLPVKVGQQAVFFTEVLLYAESIAVLEIGRIEDVKNIEDLRKQILDVLSKIADQALQRRLASAELVVVGKVTATRPAPEQVRIGPVTEHFPDWWEAVIQIDSIEKGQLPGNNITILFPQSQDVAWGLAPKFSEGQNGIWILRKETIEAFPTQSYLTALDPLDFQPLNQLERVRRLLRGIR